MTLQSELDEMRKRTEAMPLDWLIASGQKVTQERVDAIQEKQKYKGRERVPEHLLKYTDLYNELTGQEPINLSDWILTAEEWKTAKLLPEHIRTAWNMANSDRGGFPVGRPGALTVSAIAAKSKMTHQAVPVINDAAIERTKKLNSETWEGKNFVPRPASIQRPKNIPAKKGS